MSKPAAPARPDDLARRAAMAAYLDRTYRRPPEGSVFHWAYRWPSEDDQAYRTRTAPFRRWGECPARRHAMTPANTDATFSKRSCRACVDLAPKRHRAHRPASDPPAPLTVR